MLQLNPETPRIIVPLFAHALGELEAQAKAAQAAPEADLVELRLDPLRVGDWLSALAMVRGLVQKPLIVTIRTAREGGEAALDASEYRDAGLALLQQGGVDALDIEWRTDAAVVRVLRDAAKRAGAAALFSEHHFDGTPDRHAMAEALHGMLDAGAAKGSFGGVEAWHIIAICMQGLRIAIPAAALLAIPTSTVQGFLESMPAWLTDGMSIGGGMVVAVGYAMVINMMATREVWPFFAIGFCLAAISDLTLIALGAIGLSMALIYLTLSESGGSSSGGGSNTGDPLGDILNDY